MIWKETLMDDRNAPATKGDLADLAARLADVDAHLNERIEILRTEVPHGYNDLRETLRDSQTELLKAFYSFGQTSHLS
jgi:hypothetical protein